MKLSVYPVVIILTCCLVAAGCGSGATSSRKLVKITGTVKYDGKPLPQGTITFVTTGQGATNAAGDLDSSGRYSLSTQEKGDGVPPGSYKVRIESWASPPKMDASGLHPGKSAIPKKYDNAEASGLTATVKDSPASQVIDFTLAP